MTNAERRSTRLPAAPSKSPSSEPRFETVDRLLRHARYDDLLDECLTLAAERGTLESRDDFEPDEEYETLQRRLEEVFTALDELVATFDGDDFRAEFATCELGTPTEHTPCERASLIGTRRTGRNSTGPIERIPISGADSQGRIHRYTRRIRTARYSVQYIRPWALGRPMSQESEYTEGTFGTRG